MNVTIQAQQKFISRDAKSTATFHIQELRDGVLLVRLPSNRKKTEALERTLAGDLTNKEHTNITKSLRRTNEETQDLHNEIRSAMEGEYTFSGYAFFMDYDTREVLNAKGKIVSSDMKSHYELKDSAIVYIMSVGRTTETMLDAFIILDNTLQEIPSPFPGQISRSGLAGIFGNDTSHIKRINKKLWRFYNSTIESQLNN